MFYVGERPLELIICLLDVLKNDFGEHDEAMFQDVEHNFNILIIVRSDMDVVV
jgi:hypothetical protein